jgi:hypothetical protein
MTSDAIERHALGVASHGVNKQYRAIRYCDLMRSAGRKLEILIEPIITMDLLQFSFHLSLSGLAEDAMMFSPTWRGRRFPVFFLDFGNPTLQ